MNYFVIKDLPNLDLKRGDELILNENTQRYEFIRSMEDSSEHVSFASENSVSFSEDYLKEFPEYFEPEIVVVEERPVESQPETCEGCDECLCPCMRNEYEVRNRREEILNVISYLETEIEHTTSNEVKKDYIDAIEIFRTKYELLSWVLNEVDYE